MKQHDPFDPMRAFHEPRDPISEIDVHIKLSMPRYTDRPELVDQFVEALKKCVDTFEVNGILAQIDIDETIAI